MLFYGVLLPLAEAFLFLTVPLTTDYCVLAMKPTVGNNLVTKKRIRDRAEKGLGQHEKKLTRKIDNLDGKVNEMEKRFDGRFDELEGGLGNVEGRLSSMENILHHILSEIEKLREDKIISDSLRRGNRNLGSTYSLESLPARNLLRD